MGKFLLARSVESRLDGFRSRRVAIRTRQRLDQSFLSLEETHRHIAEIVIAGRPFAVARPGVLEARWTDLVLRHRLTALEPLHPSSDLLPPGLESWSDATVAGLDEFCVRYAAAAFGAEILAHWPTERQWDLHGSPLCAGRQVHIRASDLSPFSALQAGVSPWTQALAGLRLMIVHPFEQSIRTQWGRRADISIVRDLMPDAQIEVIRPPILSHDPGRYWLGDRRWVDQLAGTLDSVAAQEFDVALVAAGPLGLLIADGIRLLGRTAIHLGGTLQLLFGIRGGRWDRKAVYPDSDDSWIRPIPEDVAPEIRGMEGGAYA